MPLRRVGLCRWWRRASAGQAGRRPRPQARLERCWTPGHRYSPHTPTRRGQTARSAPPVRRPPPARPARPSRRRPHPPFRLARRRRGSL